MATGGKSFPLSVIVSAVDKITGPLRKINGVIGGVGSSMKNLGGTIRGVSDRSGLPILANAFANVGKSAFSVVGRVALIGGAVVGAATAGIAALVPFAKAFADSTGAIGDLANQTGASRERIQELGYAAQLSGSSMESLSSALQKMNITVANAKAGSKELKNLFSGLKIKPADVATTDKAFDTFVDRISRIKDPVLQAKAAMMVFGKGATDLLPLLRGGTKELKATTDEARRLGIVLPEATVGVGEDFGDTLDKITFALKGVSNSIGAAVVPMLNTLGEKLVETIVKYRPQIEAFAAAFADKLPGYIDKAGEALDGLVSAIKPVGKAFTWLVDNFGVANTAMGLVAVTVSAILIPPLVALAGALFTVGAALLATPIGWIILGLTALAAIVLTIYKNWDGFAKFFTDKFQAVKDAFKVGIVDGLIQVWKEFNPISMVVDSINGLVKFISGIDLGQMIKDKLSGVSAAVKVNVGKVAGGDAPAIDPSAFGGPTKAPVLEIPKIPSPLVLPAPAAKDTNAPSPLALVPKTLEQTAINVIQQVAPPIKQVTDPVRLASNAPNMVAPVDPAAMVSSRQAPRPQADPNYTAIPEGGVAAAGAANSKASVTVDFRNLPQGTQVQTDTSGGTSIKVNQGYSMVGGL